MGWVLAVIALTVDTAPATLVIEGMEGRLVDLSPALKKIGESVLEDARNQIVSQGALFGGGWAEMSPLTSVVATKLYKRGRDPRTLLQDTRGLLNSLTPGDTNNISEVTPASASFGSAYVSARTGWGIAAVQQQGSSRTFHVLEGDGYSEPGIPPRPFLTWREEQAPVYEGILAEHVLGATA